MLTPTLLLYQMDILWVANINTSPRHKAASYEWAVTGQCLLFGPSGLSSSPLSGPAVSEPPPPQRKKKSKNQVKMMSFANTARSWASAQRWRQNSTEISRQPKTASCSLRSFILVYVPLSSSPCSSSCLLSQFSYGNGLRTVEFLGSVDWYRVLPITCFGLVPLFSSFWPRIAEHKRRTNFRAWWRESTISEERVRSFQLLLTIG